MKKEIIKAVNLEKIKTKEWKCNILGIPSSTLRIWERKEKTGNLERVEIKRRKITRITEILPETKANFIEFAIEHPELRHRKLTLKYVDEKNDYLSEKSGYRILKKAGLVFPYKVYNNKNGDKNNKRRYIPTKVNECWQVDIIYIWIHEYRCFYYLINVLDVFSRYWVYLKFTDTMGSSVIEETIEEAMKTLPEGAERPIIQTDNGNQLIGKRMQKYFKENGIKNRRIHYNCPNLNAEIERLNLTIRIEVTGIEIFTDPIMARKKIEEFRNIYNEERYNLGIGGVPPATIYFGTAESIIARRKQAKIFTLQKRKEVNTYRKMLADPSFVCSPLPKIPCLSNKKNEPNKGGESYHYPLLS